MKGFFRKLFSPILGRFETGDGPYAVKPLNRKILVFIGLVFFGLASAVAYLSFEQRELGYLVPALVLSAVSLVSLVVGLLGSDRAVANIWGNR